MIWPWGCWHWAVQGEPRSNTHRLTSHIYFETWASCINKTALLSCIIFSPKDCKGNAQYWNGNCVSCILPKRSLQFLATFEEPLCTRLPTRRLVSARNGLLRGHGPNHLGNSGCRTWKLLKIRILDTRWSTLGGDRSTVTATDLSKRLLHTQQAGVDFLYQMSNRGPFCWGNWSGQPVHWALNSYFMILMIHKHWRMRIEATVPCKVYIIVHRLHSTRYQTKMPRQCSIPRGQNLETKQSFEVSTKFHLVNLLCSHSRLKCQGSTATAKTQQLLKSIRDIFERWPRKT